MRAWRLALERWLTNGWQRRGLVYWMFLDLSVIHGWVYRLRHNRRRTSPSRLTVPVIIVGNLVVGGAGKTPVVMALAQALLAQGRRPGIIARGHGAPVRQPTLVDAHSDPAQCGDEPVMLAQRTGLPVAVHPQRVEAAHALLDAHPEIDVIVSDDGLQHSALPRAFELIVFDRRGAGNAALLPAGPLREPLDRHRDATVFSDTPIDARLSGEAPAYAATLEPVALRPLDVRLPALPLTDLHGRSVAAWAGIGHPQKFFDMLTRLGATVVPHPVPDHAPLADYRFSSDPAWVVMTAKDAVKCVRNPDFVRRPHTYVLDVASQLPDALIAQIMEKLDGSQTA